MTEPRRVVWQGELVSPRALFARGLAVLFPGIGWLMLLLVLPTFVLAAVAFCTRGPLGQVEWTPSLGSFRRLAGYGVLGWSLDTLWTIGRSLWIALLTTVLTLAVAYPLAFVMAAAKGPWRAVWLAIVVVPMCINLVVRTVAWQLVLAPQLPPAQLCAWLGLTDQGDALYPGTVAVLLGMVSNALPFAALPLWTNVERLDWSLVEAAQDLYSTRLSTLWRAILPQTTPGLTVAAILTFIPATGMYVITDRLGGSKVMYLGNLIQQQFAVSSDFPFGAAVSLVMVVLTLGGMALVRSKGKGLELL